jgi:4-hydroxy-4-methyl-2-oxoglutarate aldolase
MTEALAERLQHCYTGIIHDTLRDLGLADFTFPPELRPLLPDVPMAGPAFTIEGVADPTADPHQTLLAWTGLLSRAPAGHVWVAQPHDRVVAHMGELSAQALMRKGLRGCLIDGLVRDVRFLLDIGFQTWCHGFTPRDIVGHWLPKAVDAEIRIGDVTVAPGDFILGDRDGALRIPQAIVADVIARAEAAMGTESRIRSAILAGTDPQQAYLQFGKF